MYNDLYGSKIAFYITKKNSCFLKINKISKKQRLLRPAVRTSPFHGGNTGSNPVGVTSF